MNRAAREGFEEALRECATERIHQIGHVQPHGAVLVFEADSLHTVRQASANFGDFVDLPKGIPIGQPLAAILGEPGNSQVLQLIRSAAGKQSATGALEVVRSGASIDLQAHLYATDKQWALELEPDDGAHQEANLAQLQLQFQQSLLEFDSDVDLARYLNEVVRLVRDLTGYDRVMVYRFNERWDGEIIAQVKVASAPSYLGHHFPASDIPPQARRLYASNLVRIVADVNAKPVPISPAINAATGEPLDMTYSALRSLSPVHLEYLRNIGVAASMVVSLMQDGQLWGMVACHHMAPKRVSIAMRNAAIFISRMVSAKLSSIAALEQRAKVNQANALVNDLVKSIATDDESATIRKLLPGLMQVLDATGVIVVVEGQPHVHGAVPDAKAVRALLDWLSGKVTSPEIFATDELAKLFEPARSYADVASGLLATAPKRDLQTGIVWLRRDKPRTVQWAGDYQSGLTLNAAGNFRLTPRKSFEIWCETWAARSEPWSRADTGIAAMLSLSVPEAIHQKHKLEVEQARFRQAHLVSENTVKQFNKLTGAIPGVVYQFLITPTGSWNYVYLSTYVRALFEVAPDEVCKDHHVITRCIVEEHRALHQASIEKAHSARAPWVHEYQIQTRSGAKKWIHGQALPELQADGSVLWHGILTDITARKAMDAALQTSEQKFRLIAENTSDGITIFDKHRTIQYASPAVAKQLGYAKQEELGRSSDDVYAMLDPQGRDAVVQTLNEAIEAKAPELRYSYRIRHKDGHYIWREDSANFRYTNAGEYDGSYVVSRDITERKRMEEEVRQLAYFDALTQLPNRRMLNDRLLQAVAASKRSGRYGAAMVLDLDNFKPLNDQHGHAVGDLLLVEVARRLTSCVRQVDTVARFGGDEFVLVLGDLDENKAESQRQAHGIAEKVRLALVAPYQLRITRLPQRATTVTHHCAASIGVVLFVNPEAAPDDILKWADAAMYEAKAAGRNAIQFHDGAVGAI
jgi:diguanylate cyclase (GGDEF)-like protein/PAS domain S-box-containing protein